tara:strand:+ start:43 stop:516 length:474 start_codon:yes stop_codon:yes gene_type:complete
MISKKQIEDEGKAQYSKWREEKDKSNYLKAQNMVAKITSPGGMYEWVDSDYHKNGGYIGSNFDFDWSTAQPGQGLKDRDDFVDKLKYLESIDYFKNDKGGTVENDFKYRSKQKYKLTLPGGKNVELEGPRGATKDQLIEAYNHHVNKKSSEKINKGK